MLKLGLKRGTFLVFFLSFCSFLMAQEVEITLLATSDLHGRIYPHNYATDSADSDAGFAKVSSIIKDVRDVKDNVILMDLGDTMQDNSAELFNDLPLHPMIQILNDLEYDTWTVGNHEFNFSQEIQVKNALGFKGDVLGANLRMTDTGVRPLKPYSIQERDGVRVAVVGLTPPKVPIWEASTPEHFAGVSFYDPLEEVGRVMDELDGKYDILVGAFHLGVEGEESYTAIRDIAEAYPEFDVIFGGHAHAKVNTEINGVTVMEPGAYGWAVSAVNLTLRKSGFTWSVQDIETRQLETKEAVSDPEILAKYAYVHETSVANANTIVGVITRDFIPRPDYITGDDEITTAPTSQLIDTSVIDLINTVQAYYSEADISSAALFNFGSNLKAGDFKKKDVAFIYKYDNTLVGTKISGDKLKEYMEWSVSYYNGYEKGDVTISFNENIRGYNYDMFEGFSYEIDLSKPVGSRIVNAMYNGKAMSFDKNTSYKLGVNNYRFGTLMSHGWVTMDDKYYDSYEEMQDAGRIRDLIIKYVQEEMNGILKPSVDNNWAFTGFSLDHPYREDIYEAIRDGRLSIPTSADGRTMNVKSINVFDMAEEYDVDSYIVEKGDWLSTISPNFDADWEDIAELNLMDDPHLIYPGDKIYFP